MYRTAQLDDLDAIMAIVVAAGLFSPEDRDFLGDALRDFHDRDTASGAGFLLDIDEVGDPVGVVSWNPRIATDAGWDLTMIAVLPERQGEGRGAAMMAHVERERACPFRRADHAQRLPKSASIPNLKPDVWVIERYLGEACIRFSNLLFNRLNRDNDSRILVDAIWIQFGITYRRSKYVSVTSIELIAVEWLNDKAPTVL